MTVLSTTSSQRFHGSGSTGPFTFAWRFLANSDIKVYRIAEPNEDPTLEDRQLLAEGVDYSLNGAGSYTGGSLVLSSALLAGQDLVIDRFTATVQKTDIRNQGNNFYPEVHEDAFDAQVMMIQDRDREVSGNTEEIKGIKPRLATAEAEIVEHKARIETAEPKISRSLKFPLGDSTDPTLPTIANRSNKYAIFDAQGKPGAADLVSSANGYQVSTSPLAEALAQYDSQGALGGTAKIIPDLSTLRTLQGSAGQVVYLVGRTTAGDGGQGEFVGKTGAVGEFTDDDGITIVPGDGSFAWVRQFSGAVNLRWYGDASLARALSSAFAVGDDINIWGDTWVLDADVTIPSGKRIFSNSGGTIRRDSVYKFLTESATFTELTAASDLDYGSTLITLSAASYASVAEGDYLHVKNKDALNADYITDFVNTATADLNDPSKWVYQTQTFKIVEKLSGDRIRVDSAASVSFPLTGVGSIYKLSGATENIVLEGITFENGDSLASASAEDSFFLLRYAYGVDIVRCKFKLKGITGGVYVNFGQVDIERTHFNESKNLAVFLRQSAANSTILGCTFRNQTTNDSSIFIEAHNYNVRIIGNTFDGARSQELSDAAQLISAIQMDAKVHNVTISGNTVNGYGVGFRLELGCMLNTITGNTVKNSDISAIRMSQSSHNTVIGNTFYNSGLAVSPGTLADAQAAIFVSASDSNIFDGNAIANDASKASPGFLVSGSGNTIKGNKLTNITSNALYGENNRVLKNVFYSMATTQILMITGASAHYNAIENNTFKAAESATYGVRIDSGAECNTVKGNGFENVSNAVGLTSTSNAQSLLENYVIKSDYTTTSNVYNIEISAPVMPTNATMPRRFRIYSTTTAAVSGALEPQGAKFWEFLMELSGTRYFREFAFTTSQVGI